MRRILTVALGMIGAPAFAAGACLSPDEARIGALTSVRHQMLNQSWLTFYLLKLPKKSCVTDVDGDRHDDQIEIGLFPRDQKQIARLVGKKVHIDGDGPQVGDTQYNIRDLTFQNAVAVPIH